ncbi:unnamed protein product [Chrysodeixis includens]|uniref:Cilia- and flagella-associated protein 61 N-terminal domain-containing protein n=1 Tax=Chrysodeixis includens TaxID=689277 RepID=A0A9P0BW29_CHRIL|nr:unnamed protein product [Chrysodeixis includens]
MIDENKEVTGFIAFSDHPDILGLHPSEWENWIRNLFQRFYLSRNTLFIHFMCCTDAVKDFFLEEAFIAVFLNDYYLQYIVLAVPLFCPDELITRFLTYKKRNIYKYLPKGKEGFGDYLLSALRADFCPKLKMRRAVEEDNDDLVEILDKKCPRLKQLYGEYYISEIIGRHPESTRKIIVADIQGRAVAVMCLNTDINYKKLQKIYELRPYHGLKTATALEKEHCKRSNALLSDFGEPIMLGKWSPFDEPSRFKCNPQRDFQTKSKTLTRNMKNSSRVNFQGQAGSMDHVIVRCQSEDFSEMCYMPSPSLSASLFSVVNLLDEDPFDYDIVNIDTALILNETRSQDMLKSTLSLVGKHSSDANDSFSKTHKLEERSSLQARKIKFPRPRPKMNINLEEKDSEYHGGKNAFMIELCAFREDIDDRHAYDLLEAAFELTKDYDYCIIRVPTSDKTFPLLQHFCYVPTKQKVCCNYSLYVAHRSSVLGKLRVREAEIIDIPQIARLMANLDGKETIATVEQMINKPENQATPDQIDFLRGRFNLDSYQIHKYHVVANGLEAGFGTLKCAIAYPVFEPHFRYFTRELMRLSGHSTLLWMTAYRNKWTIHKANSIVASMIPLTPRPVDIDSEAVPELKRISTLIEKITPFSCWFISRKFTSIPRADVNTRIVIVGASRTALGFINSLLFGQTSTYLTFTDVTLVSPNGLPYIRRSKPIAESMFLKHYRTTDKYLKSVPYTYYMNVIQGTMMEIDLHEKFITLTSGRRFHYDFLFLCFGKQYQHPDHMKQLIQRDIQMKYSASQYTRLDEPTLSDTEIQITNDETPENVFIVNTVAEASRALDYVKQFAFDCHRKIIVYGATIHAYLCINALLDMRVRPESIVFVEPFPYENPTKTRVSVFHNTNVDQTMIDILQSLNIKVYRSFYFKSWSTTIDNIITRADFLSYADYVEIECAALFYYGTIGVNMRAFIAIHKSGLAYDGGIVVDHECRTLDPYVYAAGPCTRYHKRYRADSRSHKYYDCYELGEKLGAQIRNQLDPLFTGATPAFRYKWLDDLVDADKLSYYNRLGSTSGKLSAISLHKGKAFHGSDYARPEMALIDLTKPSVMCCVLPGGLKYLEVRSPGLKTPHNYVQSLDYNGFVMETFKGGYFKIHLTKDLVVDGITCLCQGKFSLENFKYLYGRPASELNNMHVRYMAHKLDDFFKYFRSPWAFFLYHDHSDDLFAMIKQLFPKGENKGKTLKEALREVGVKQSCSCPIFTINTKMDIQANFEKSPHIEAVTDYVIDWLSRNDILLPMYLQPGQTAQYAHDLQNHPVFAKKEKTLSEQKDHIEKDMFKFFGSNSPSKTSESL